VPVVTALRATRRGRVAVHVDGEFFCAVSDAAVARWRLHKGRELSAEDLEHLRDDASVELVLADAYRLLGHRARSEQELRRRLLAKDHVPEAVDIAVQRLAGDDLLDDAEFARSYVADKRRLAGWGMERIRRGLAEAGVSPAFAEQALGAADAADSGDGDGEMQRALEVLRRRGGAHERPDEAARRRAYQTLLRRGFGHSVAYAAVKAWSSRAPGELDEDPGAPDRQPG
jgi:regulatory protein